MSKPRIILIGGGGHCKACIDVIEMQEIYQIAGIIDINNGDENLFGYKFLGNDVDLPDLKKEYCYALITVGQIKSPSNRMRLFNHVKSLGFIFPTIISPLAYVSEYATVGEGSIVMHGGIINAAAVVGRNSIINTKALIEHDVVIGDHCHISTGSIINGSAIINNGTFVGSNSTVIGSAETQEDDFIKAGSLFVGVRHSNE